MKRHNVFILIDKVYFWNVMFGISFFELLHTFFRILIKKMVYTMQFYFTIDFHHKCKFSTCIYCGILYLIFWIICSRVWDYMCKSWVNHLCFLWADLFGIWNLKKRFFTMFGQSHKDRSSERNKVCTLSHFEPKRQNELLDEIQSRNFLGINVSNII